MRWTAENAALAKRILVLSVLVAALVVAIQVEPAAAAPCRAFTRWFYEEPEQINVCGWIDNNCSHIDRQGCQTPWEWVEFGICCGPGGHSGGPLCDC